jgi:hypothetical protein
MQRMKKRVTKIIDLLNSAYPADFLAADLRA